MIINVKCMLDFTGYFFTDFDRTDEISKNDTKRVRIALKRKELSKKAQE